MADKKGFGRGGSFMGGWKTKLIFLLIVYFAGFATAIYYLAPVPENQGFQNYERNFDSEKFVESFSAGMHKSVDFTKDFLWRTGKFIKQKLDERET